MSRTFWYQVFSSGVIFLLLGLSGLGYAEQAKLPTLVLNTAYHFLTPAGDDVEVPSGTYQVEPAESWLKLLPEGEDRSSSILLEAVPGTHHQEITEKTIRAEPDATNPDLFHIAILLPDGTGLEALGTVSGIRPRGSVLAFLRTRMPSRSPKTASVPTFSFTKPIDCGPYSKDIGKQEGERPPALAVFQNRLHMIVNPYQRTGIPSHSRFFDPIDPLEHWVYGNGQWTRSRGPGGGSKRGVALASFGGRLHMVRVGNDSEQLYHATFDGSEWTAAVKIPKQKSKFQPALAEFEGLLHLLYVKESSVDVWHSTNRGRGWTIPKKTGIKSLTSPALTISPVGFRRPLLHMVTTEGPGGALNIKYLFLSAFGGGRWSSPRKISDEFTILPPSLASTQSGSEKWLQLIHTDKSTQALRQKLYGPYQSGRKTTFGWFDDQRLLNQKSEASPGIVFFSGCWHMVTVKDDRLLHSTFSTTQVHPRAR